VRPHLVDLQLLAADHRQLGLAVGVLDVHLGDGGETVLLGDLAVALRVVAAALVRRVALHDGAPDLLDQVLDQVMVSM
jgi:hypothetical protein